MSYTLKRSERLYCFDKGITIRKPKPGEKRKYNLRRLNMEEDEDGNLVKKEYVPPDVTWIYGSTEEERQKYINDLIDDDMREYVSHVYKITKSSNIKGEFAEDETKILVIHNLKAANIGEQDICRMIDGGSFSLGYYSWNNVYIFPEKVYISSDKLPEQVYARSEFKERVIRRVARTIKLD